MRSATWWAATKAAHAGARRRLLTGSHYDTVRNGGKYDGRLGIFTPMACVRELSRQGRRLPFDFEVIGFAEEEGQRYKATFLGSGALIGDFDPAWLDQKDADGVTMREAMQQAGLPATLEAIAALRRDPARLPGLRRGPYRAGPGAERDATCRWASSPRSTAACAINARSIGMASHAGTTPMDRRRDAATAVAELALYVEQRAARDGDSVGTIGMLNVPGGSINVVPGRCQFTLDLRAPTDAAARRAGERRAGANSRRSASAAACATRTEETMRAAAAPSAPDWQQRWEARRGRAGRAAAPHAQRRRPRRDEAARGDAAGHAVRARPELGHQPQPAGEHAPATTSSWPSRLSSCSWPTSRDELQ